MKPVAEIQGKRKPTKSGFMICRQFRHRRKFQLWGCAEPAQGFQWAATKQPLHNYDGTGRRAPKEQPGTYFGQTGKIDGARSAGVNPTM